MGLIRTQGMAEAVSEGEIDLHTALVDHLQINHFPPISPAFIPVAMEAIRCANEGTWEVMQTYPSGLLRPVRDTIEGLHLEPFLKTEEAALMECNWCDEEFDPDEEELECEACESLFCSQNCIDDHQSEWHD